MLICSSNLITYLRNLRGSQLQPGSLLKLSHLSKGTDNNDTTDDFGLQLKIDVISDPFSCTNNVWRLIVDKYL